MRVSKSISKDYLNLIYRFPLMPIHTKEELQQAATLVDELSDRLDTLSSSERAYFDVLCNLIQRYESNIHKPANRLSPSALKKRKVAMTARARAKLVKNDWNR